MLYTLVMASKDEVLKLLFDLLHGAIALEDRIDTYNTNVRISGSEIFLIKIIAENPGCHITAAAKKIGVSKAAISQLARKVEKKGLIKRRVAQENKSKYNLHITPKGKIAHAEHMKVRRDVEERFRAILSQYNEEQLHILKSLFDKSIKTLGEL